MRVPIRKPGKYAHHKPDAYITVEKLQAFKDQLEKLQNVSQPQAIAEVRRLAELGDFSENAAYQMAKGRLRGINDKIFELEERIKQAKIIQPINTGQVHLGSQVTVEIDGHKQTYKILGSTETNPSLGVISYQSPIGAALINHEVGDEVVVQLREKVFNYRILEIN